MQISIEQLKTEYLKLIDDVQKHHHEIIITKFGKPIAKIVSIADEKVEKFLFGYMKDSVIIHGDILEPIGEKWKSDE
ncbi:type II toxin-antitoxin system prevent-host-death family antitoxin [bacterium]|nr:type II toxin-antitoxin system prevent-host-death family antitoxin [bacterium]